MLDKIWNFYCNFHASAISCLKPSEQTPSVPEYHACLAADIKMWWYSVCENLFHATIKSRIRYLMGNCQNSKNKWPWKWELLQNLLTLAIISQLYLVHYAGKVKDWVESLHTDMKVQAAKGHSHKASMGAHPVLVGQWNQMLKTKNTKPLETCIEKKIGMFITFLRYRTGSWVSQSYPTDTCMLLLCTKIRYDPCTGRKYIWPQTSIITIYKEGRRAHSSVWGV